MASYGPSAPPYTVTNQSHMGIPIDPSMGATSGQMPMQQPPPYPMQPPQPAPYPMQPQQPYPYPMQPAAPVNNSTVNVHQISAPTTEGQTVYVIKKKTGGCCVLLVVIIASIIIGVVFGVRKSRFSSY